MCVRKRDFFNFQFGKDVSDDSETPLVYLDRRSTTIRVRRHITYNIIVLHSTVQKFPVVWKLIHTCLNRLGIRITRIRSRVGQHVSTDHGSHLFLGEKKKLGKIDKHFLKIVYYYLFLFRSKCWKLNDNTYYWWRFRKTILFNKSLLFSSRRPVKPILYHFIINIF